MANPLVDLICPLTLEWLEDPITLPCCGKSVSREPLVTWQTNSNICPLCRQNLGTFNGRSVPKSVNLAYLVEQAIATNQPKPEIKPSSPPKLTAKIHRLCNNSSINQTVVGRLEFYTIDNKYNFKTLVIPVTDRSGSMSGAPTAQVKYSLNRIVDLLYNNSQLMVNLVTYNDSFDIIELNAAVPKEHSRDIIEKIYSRGGTSFDSAFNGIIKIIEKYKAVDEISNIVIVFLTDGEDSSIPKDKRVDLVKGLKEKIEKIWAKKYIVHSVGFNANHDSDFLNALRQIGTAEGAYRYADPSENPDSLSGKINSLLDVIAQSSAVPLRLVPTENNPPVISGDNDKYWINLRGHYEDLEFRISVNNEELITVKAEYAEDENDPKIWELWYSYLIDEIASELLMLSNQKEDGLDKQIHCELLEQRARAIMARIDGISANAIRLEKLVDTLKAVKSNGVVNILKLNDLKYEGQYATKLSNESVTVTMSSTNQYIPLSTPITKKPWPIIDKKKVRRCNARDTSKEFLKVLGRYNSKNACDWITTNIDTISKEVDATGSNMLMVASMLGRCKLVTSLLQTDVFDINMTNNESYNAIDLAIIYGYWHTADILRMQGAKPSQPGDILLRTCLSNGFFNTAAFLIKYKFSVITDDMMDNAPTNETISWLSARSQKEIAVETAILKGMYDVVEEKLDSVKSFSWKPYINIFTSPTPDHYRIVELLIKSGKADPNEQIEIVDDNEKGFTWPLFLACEKGQLSMFNLLIKYALEKGIDRQNHKGTTVLWIACCNRHIDIVGELLNSGANPNVPNLKGDGPLIPACQKGNELIVDMLLEAGASLNAYNKNRDGPVLICCRTGQSKILEKLLRTLKPPQLKTILETYADIDQFRPLIAAAELDKIECIKICHKFGADLEDRIPIDNQMVPGGTALHLASFYGRLAAVKTLIDLGADIRSRTSVHGYTALHLAIKNNHINVVRYLLQRPNIRECMEIEDNEGRIPSYYARQQGNEQMFEEFFTNKLAVHLGKLLYAGPEMEKKCGDILVRYGQSLLCYEHDEITKTNINDGATILSYALLNGNENLLASLQKMGADFTKEDDFGVSPQFWATYLGYNIPGLVSSSRVTAMVDKIKTVASKSMQNKMLTNLQGGHPAIEYGQTISSLIKMSDGYGTKVNMGVLTTLKKSASMDHSLLGFIDKLKSKREFPDGEDVLKYLIFDAKVNLIKRIASTDTVLSPIHLLALYLYTSNDHIFRSVNQTLALWQKNSIWHPFINTLYQGITLIEPYENEVYRAVDTNFNLEDYAIGNKLRWDSFSICSSEWKTCSDLIGQKRGIVFVIRSKMGRNISPYSRDRVDAPVCFLPATEFLITNHFSPSITALAQKNIRTTTFKIKEKDYERAFKGEASIIIELDEIVASGPTVEEVH